MADPLDAIDRLARIARTETAPGVEVSGRVMSAIGERQQWDDTTPLQWIAAGAGLASSAVCLGLVPLFRTWSDPINRLIFDLFQVVL